ncbi:MAG: FUN14 domain-containing protein, partial [Defluviitaleaceae bacterium]|nr:FUN14 domain-containing protein [Defluviitaleaceae bacterium]
MWRKNNSERKQDGIYQKTSATKMLVKKFVKIVSLIVGISLIILFAASYGYITHANNVFQDHLARAQAAELEELEQLRGAAAGDDVTTLETGEHAEIVDEPIESAR